MISICIPIYNFNVCNLVTELHYQGVSTSIPFEILLMDDASDESYKIQNRTLRKFPFVQYYELEENIGRSRIRNQLAVKARYDYLLYIDCDAKVISPNFIANYINYCYKDVICVGGTSYAPQKPVPRYLLRWKIGVKRESANAYQRSKYPNANFSTFNFLMDRDFFLKVCFNEKLTGYGHEDTLFSFDLYKHNVPIRHIDNPLQHIGLETGPEVLCKCKQGIRNVRMITQLLNNDPLFIKNLSLLNWGYRIQVLHATAIFAWIYSHLYKLLEKNLLGKRPNLFLFSLWKESYYCYLEKNKDKGPLLLES